jgi:plastocyanin
MSRIFALLILLLFSSFAFAGKVSGSVKAGGTSAVVLEPVPAKTFPASTQNASMDQRGMKFTPSLLVIQQGATVEFKNSDTVSHNIFWPNVSGNKKLGHNIGTSSSGQTVKFKFDNPGSMQILCNIHPEMSANIVVSPSPYFAQTDTTGAYSIGDVPDGEYKATAWHNGKAATQNITVKGDTKADFAAAGK